MDRYQLLTYKIADTAEEMEQIYQLNYQTFVEEIPQHERNDTKKLVDRFDKENTYIVAKNRHEVVAMIAVRGDRPFSLDQKLGDVDIYLPKGSISCEIRLLSVKEAYRGRRTFYGLCGHLVSYCLKKGYNIALISGTDRQTRLYKHIGFRPFGPPVGTESARYQPMYLTKETFESTSKAFQRLMQKEKFSHSFLPGPVPMREEVKEAWRKPALSHRSALLHREMREVKNRLVKLTSAQFAEIIVGTGTLANDMVAAQLSRFPGKGIILSNGEFGDRLLDHGKRWGLLFAGLQKPWNTPITPMEIEKKLIEHPDVSWMWTVHCETSTGYVYPLEELKDVCRKYGVRLCLDACSSIGVFPVDLSGVFLTSTVSGKGIGSYPGLAILFHEERIRPDGKLPAYLDLGTYAEHESVPYTHSSNQLAALNEALKVHVFSGEELASRAASAFKEAGMDVLGRAGYSPGVVTVALPSQADSKLFGDQLKARGILVSYESSYLLKRNWFQVALMGEQQSKDVKRAVGIILDQFQELAQERHIQKG